MDEQPDLSRLADPGDTEDEMVLEAKTHVAGCQYMMEMGEYVVSYSKCGATYCYI